MSLDPEVWHLNIPIWNSFFREKCNFSTKNQKLKSNLERLRTRELPRTETDSRLTNKTRVALCIYIEWEWKWKVPEILAGIWIGFKTVWLPAKLKDSSHSSRLVVVCSKKAATRNDKKATHEANRETRWEVFAKISIDKFGKLKLAFTSGLQSSRSIEFRFLVRRRYVRAVATLSINI